MTTTTTANTKNKRTKPRWFEEILENLSKQTGYQKPPSYPDALKLDSNENLVIGKSFQQEIIQAARKRIDVREYPLGGTERLVQALSKYLKNIPANMIGVGNGSDQILDLILVNFATNKKRRVLTTDPTFGFFEERCKLYSIPSTKVPFSRDMKLDVDELLKKSKNCHILYLDSPNNPTGFQFPKSDLTRIISNFDGLIIIDEAYAEFSDYSVMNLTKKFDNLIVVRTLSKSFGLAGMRLGYFVANKKITDVLSRVIQYPYPLNTLAIEAGILALEKSGTVLESIDTIKRERQRIMDNLRKLDAFDVFDSNANFVLFDAGGADKRVFTALKEQGILIRQLGEVGKYKGCLRITVGTKDMNSKFLLAIRDLLG